jgi:hypothetical protein
MANTVYSTINIWASDRATDKLINMVNSLPKSKSDLETKDIVNHFYSDSEIMSLGYNPVTETGVDIKWLNKWVGCKWISVRVEDDIKIESAHIPNGFAIKLWTIAAEIDPDCQLTCNWTDETQAGTVYIKNGICAESYVDIEEDLESDELWDAITEAQDSRVSSCEEAVDTEDFDFPDVKMYRIANKKWEVVSNLIDVMS